MTRQKRWWLTVGRDEEAHTRGANTGETADVLLQVVLPIVLILTYCVLQSARNYIAAVDEVRGKYRQALLELQKQRIIAALETVENRRRQDLGLAFLSQKEIRLTGSGQLVSDHLAFRAACRMTAQIFLTDDSQARERTQIYELVLKAAELADARSFEADTAPAGASLAVQTERAERGEITDANRVFLKAEIGKFLAGLHQEVVQLELRVMQAALEIYRAAPLAVLYRWNPQLETLKKAIVQALNQGTDPAAYEESLLHALFRQIREDFDKQGYSFLPEIWETV
jgi:hypothetical protein